MKNLVFLFLSVLFYTSCSVTKKTTSENNKKLSNVQMISNIKVYKTKGKYVDLVPVILSEDKMKIVSYPSQSDIKSNGIFLKPILLHDEYLLDRKGINLNVAFLKLTYEEYAQLKEIPSIKELYELILDKDPLKELCDCGSKTDFTSLEIQLNELIDNQKLRTKCKAIK